MAFALAVLLNPATVERRSALLSATLVIVVVTTFVIGASTPLALRVLGIPVGEAALAEEAAVMAAASAKTATAVSDSNGHGRKDVQTLWSRLDRYYIMPYLSRRYLFATDAQAAGISMTAVPLWNPDGDGEAEGDNQESTDEAAQSKSLAGVVVHAAPDASDASDDDDGSSLTAASPPGAGSRDRSNHARQPLLAATADRS